MESELKDLSPKSPPPPPPPPSQSTTFDASSATDDHRPLLKSDHSSPATFQPSIDELEKRFAAYVRHDVYGTMGLGDLPWPEKFLLGFAIVTLLPLRIALSMTVLVVYYLICRVCTLFLAPNGDDEQEDYAHMGGWRRAVVVRTGRFLARVLLFIIGFYWIPETCKVSHSNMDNELMSERECKLRCDEPERPGAIVSNHVSYIDILYHMSSSFPSFVAKRSVGKLPLVGLISKCLGCVYVQRESKSPDFKGVSGVVNERIQEAHRNKSAPMMMLFPEGTTTNGDYLLPFKTGAFLPRTPVLPVILKYPCQRFSPAWDTISGVRHVILLFCQFVNYLEVTRLPVYYPSQQEKDEPKLFADNVRRLMAHEGNLIMSDIGLAEKRVYHAALDGNTSPPTVSHQKDE